MVQDSYEPLLNGELASILRQRGLDAAAEQRQGGKQMDVLVSLDDARVVLEAEIGTRRGAIRDADRRLAQGLTTLVFAICYEEGTTRDNIAEARMAWTLRTRDASSGKAREGAPALAEWREGTVADLAESVKHAPAEVDDADMAAGMLLVALEGAREIPPSARRELAHVLKLPTPSGKHQDGDYLKRTKRALLVLATAMLFHHRLQGRLGDQPREWSGEWPPASPGACAGDAQSVDAHDEAWKAILAVDYKPVFETARVVLAELKSVNDSDRLVSRLAGEVARIARRTTGLRHDLLGRVFHRVLETAANDGSFYTSSAAATLLAGIALRADMLDWSDPDAVAQLRIADFACGTGTLLMAAAERIREIRWADGPPDEVYETLLAELLVEHVLWGYDINLTATHMTASTLGMLSPRTKFRQMNVYSTELRVLDGQAYTGSLEFLAGQPRLAAWPQLNRQVDGDREDEDARRGKMPPRMDLVIMNPPFTSQSLRHDQFTETEEQSIKEREKEILAGEPYRAAARLHSSGGMFIALGTSRVKDDVGTLALILPSVVPTAPGNLALRQYLADAFHIELIVSSHDPQRIFFSENTKIGEVLLVCRRWASDAPKPPTRFVNLAKNPATVLDALALVRQIEANDAGSYTTQHVSAERIARGDWDACNFFSPHLVEEYRALSDTPALCALSEIADVGPIGQQARVAYTRSEVPTGSGRRALWYHKTSVSTSMRARPDVYIEPVPEKRKMADSYWEKRSRLLLPHRLRLNLARVAAVVLDAPAVGSLWTPCRPRDGDARTEAALCAWLNSSPGLFALLAGRDNRVLSYPQFSLHTLRSVPVPDFRALGDEPRDALAAAFEQLKDKPFKPFPHMAEDDVRHDLDNTVADALGLEREWLERIRTELGREPSVTDKRWGSEGKGQQAGLL